jgi:hypothetical protein
MANNKIALLLGFLLLIASLSFVCADETQVIVKALPNYNYSISLNIFDPVSGDILPGIGTLENFTDTSNGKAYFSFSSASRTVIFSVIARQNGRIVVNKKFGTNSSSYNTGGTISLELFESANIGAITGSSIANTINTSNISVQTNTSSANNVTNSTIGSQTSNKSGFLSNIKWKKILTWIGYVLGGLIAAGILFFAIKFGVKVIKNHSKYDGNIVLRKDDNKANYGFSAKEDKELTEAENKIKEAQQTIDFIKNKKKRLAEAEKRFEEAKRELERVKKF